MFPSWNKNTLLDIWDHQVHRSISKKICKKWLLFYSEMSLQMLRFSLEWNPSENKNYLLVKKFILRSKVLTMTLFLVFLRLFHFSFEIKTLKIPDAWKAKNNAET